MSSRVRFMILSAAWGLVAACLAPALAEESGALVVRVTNLLPGRGSVRLCLYDQADGFPTRPEQALRREVRAVEGDAMEIRWAGLPDGTYAVSAHQDINDNQRLDRNLIGIPREPVGVSNNPTLRWGPPRFSQAVFSWGSESRAPVTIRLPELSPALRRRLGLND
jgi:uncharacterized protein (DUF2141 family)